MFRERYELDGFFRTPHDGPPRHAVMLTAYFDESGHEGKGIVCIAGFLGNEAQWQAFVPEWKAALGPQRQFLHMTGLRWNKDSTRQLLARLGPIPYKCGLLPVVGVVRVADYEDLVDGTMIEKSHKGYFACLIPMVRQILRRIPPNERVELVFEEQREYARLADFGLRLFTMPGEAHRTADGKPQLAKWSFVPKGSTILLDPADYLAFAVREFFTAPNSKKSEWCAPIRGPRSGMEVVIPRDDIRMLIKKSQGLFREHFDDFKAAVKRAQEQRAKDGDA